MKPYSTDLRIRVIQTYENREGAMRQLATPVPWLGTMGVPLGGSVLPVASRGNAGHMARWSGRWAW